MLVVVWIMLGLVLGLLASKVVSTTGEGTVVQVLLGIAGAVVGGWLLNFFGSTGVYSAAAAVVVAIVVLVLYHLFLRRRML